MQKVVSASVWAALALGFFSYGESFAASANLSFGHVAEIEHARAELVVGPPEPDGTLRAIVKLDLADGFKTYWHVPGDGGLPPLIAVDGNEVAALLPAPKRFIDEYGEALGYKGELSIALEVPAPADGTVDVEMMVGVCAEICIPFIASLSAPLPTTTVARDMFAVQDAFSALPGEFDDAFAVRGASVVADDDAGVLVEADIALPDGVTPKDAQLFARLPGGEEFFPRAAQIVSGHQPAVLRIPVTTSLDPPELRGREVIFTLVVNDESGRSAVEGSVLLR